VRSDISICFQDATDGDEYEDTGDEEDDRARMTKNERVRMAKKDGEEINSD
jgi:hypothetical protein